MKHLILKKMVLIAVAMLCVTQSYGVNWGAEIASVRDSINKTMVSPDAQAKKAGAFYSALTKRCDLVPSMVTKYSKKNSANWFEAADGSVEKLAAQNVVKELDKPAYFNKAISDASGSDAEKISIYMDIFERAFELVELQNKLMWIDIDNVKAAYNDFSSAAGYDKAKYGAKLAELEKVCKAGYEASYQGDDEGLANAKMILALSNEILMSNPILDFDKIIVSKYKFSNNASRSIMTSALGTQINNWSDQLSAPRRGQDAEISMISNIRGEKEMKTIYKPTSKVSVSDLQLHWDGDRIMFSSVNDRGLWNIFEVNIDGSNLHEVVEVDEPDLEFFDGAYLPDGRVIAITNLGYQGVPCVDGKTEVGNMSLYDPKTKSLRRLTFDQDANWNPVVMNNGRLMYVRWEYTDLTHYYSRIVMHGNPDGTEVKALYGSGCFFPNSTFDVKPIPGDDGNKFVGIVSGHHGTVRSGRMMLFDPAKGRKSVQGIVQEFPHSKREIEDVLVDRLVDGVWPQFIKPYPLSEKYYLVAAKISPFSLWGIYLVDKYDNMTLVMEQENYGFISPVAVEKRTTPPSIPDRVDLTKDEGTVFIQDIYEGEGLENVPRGEVKKLRIFAYEYAYILSPSNHYAQGIQSGWDIKRLIGEVDVEEDGSAIFKVPANTPISIQPLDKDGCAIQWMRSWITAMPGEMISCVGCHEDQNKIVPTKRVAASLKAPGDLTNYEGGIRPFVFNLEVQPILNRACIACHSGENKLLSFVGKTVPTNTSKTTNRGVSSLKHENIDEYFGFTQSYLNLHPFVSRQGPEADIFVMNPYEYHASTSELIKMLRNNHHGVELLDHEWRTLYQWIDLNAPYHSSFRQFDKNGYNQIERRMQLAEKYNNAKVDWPKEIEDYTKLVNSKEAPTPVKPDYKAPTYKDAKAKNWPFSAAEAAKKQKALGESEMELTIADGVTLKLRKIPAGEFVMGDNKAGHQMAPESKVKISEPYWIGEIEITNEQFNVVFPEHDSRFIAQQWKDHKGPGYPANKPEQPVIRISWNEAMEFCEKISEITGKKVTLPTAEQWEWACRAGSDNDFWYGDKSTDFGKFENLADFTLQKMAVKGVDPQPMSPDDSYFKFYDFLPRERSVNDGNMLLVAGGQYEANPWGLYDMHGNVQEWTRSTYLPYPYNANSKVESDYVTIKGGFWLSRPKLATAAYRDGYLKWQKANSVGFRIVVEE